MPFVCSLFCTLRHEPDLALYGNDYGLWFSVSCVSYQEECVFPRPNRVGHYNYLNIPFVDLHLVFISVP